jgi:hypothetical protein
MLYCMYLGPIHSIDNLKTVLYYKVGCNLYSVHCNCNIVHWDMLFYFSEPGF